VADARLHHHLLSNCHGARRPPLRPERGGGGQFPAARWKEFERRWSPRVPSWTAFPPATTHTSRCPTWQPNGSADGWEA